MRRPTVRRDVSRLCKRFAFRRRPDKVVLAARRLLLNDPTTTAAAQWAADVRLLCEVNLGLNVEAGYGGSGSLWTVSKRLLALLDEAGAIGAIVHGYKTDDPAVNIVLTAIGALGEAIVAKDWTYARRMWEWLAPLHPMLIAGNPMLAHVGTVLRSNEALTHTGSNAIH